MVNNTYSDGTTTGTYTYDDLNRKLTDTTNFGPFEKTLAYTWHKNSLKKSFTPPDGSAISYAYNENNQLAGIEIPGLGTISHGAYKWTRPQTTQLPGGSTTTRDYDALMRTTSITTKDPGANPVMTYSYAFDPMDNITQKASEHGEYNYTYDDLYRLTDSDNPDVPELTDETFTYDPVGNRLTASDTPGNWAYNTNNELETHGNTSYVYDANGNMTQKTIDGVVTRFFYNIEDRLERVEDGSNNMIAFYTYDPFGRRLSKLVSGTTTCYLYSDEGLVAEYTQAGAEIKAYGWKPGSTWGTDPLFMKQGSEYYFYQNDHLGTPQKMTAVNGAVVWSAKYSSFGKAEVDPASTVENNLRLPGQYFDSETGLHYNYKRFYDPKVGRYLRVDPIGLDGGINLFVYSNANPTNYVDPYGLFWSEYFDLFGSATQLAVHGFIQAPLEFSGGFLYLGEAIEAGWRRTRSNEKLDIPTFAEILIPLGIAAFYEANENVMWLEELISRGIEENISGLFDCDVDNDFSNQQQKFRMYFSDQANMWKTRHTDVTSGNQMDSSLLRRARYINSDIGTLNRTIITDKFGDVNRNWVRFTRSILRELF